MRSRAQRGGRAGGASAVGLWDVLSLVVVGPAAAGGGLAALSVFPAGRPRELIAVAFVLGIALGSGVAVRAAGRLMVRRGRGPQSGPRVIAPYALALMAIVVMPMVAFLVARIVLVRP